MSTLWKVFIVFKGRKIGINVFYSKALAEKYAKKIGENKVTMIEEIEALEMFKINGG